MEDFYQVTWILWDDTTDEPIEDDRLAAWSTSWAKVQDFVGKMNPVWDLTISQLVGSDCDPVGDEI